MIAWMMSTKFGRFLAAIGAIIIAIFGAWLYGRETGKHRQKQDDDAANAKANEEAAEQVNQAREERSHVDSEVESLPDKGTQTVETADHTSAAGKLRDDGWMRP